MQAGEARPNGPATAGEADAWHRDDAGPSPRPTVAAAIALAGVGAVAAVALAHRLRGRPTTTLPAVPIALLTAAGAGSWLFPHWPRVVRRLGDGRRVALTFDDGPHPEHTPRVLDALAAAGSRATFFVLGRAAANAKDLLRRVSDEGHTVGIHGWDHTPLTLYTPARLRRELGRARDVIEEATCVPVRWFRPPYGFRGPAMAGLLQDESWTLVGWRLAAYDWRAQSPQEITRHVASRLRQRDIVLLHDGGLGAGFAAAALPGVLSAADRLGLECVSLDEVWTGG